jgi:hypothetical protein
MVKATCGSICLGAQVTVRVSRIKFAWASAYAFWDTFATACTRLLHAAA